MFTYKIQTTLVYTKFHIMFSLTLGDLVPTHAQGDPPTLNDSSE